MINILDFPLRLLVVAFALQALAAYVGDLLRAWVRPIRDDERDGFSVVQAATLTLLGLIIGFSFSMAVSRYDQRKNFEEAEANAIGTEFVRADLMPADDAGRARDSLRKYLEQRVVFYSSRDEAELARADVQSQRLQAELWSIARAAATAQPTPITALAVVGMNDVLNSQGYTQAAWWNRIPLGAWTLMTAIAIVCNILVSYGQRRTHILWLMVLPITVSISFFLIADIDSPRSGIIRVLPQNLISLSHSLNGP
jgi:hypothetical protein